MSFEILHDHYLVTERYIAPLNALEKYKDDPNVFVTFTNKVEPRGQSNVSKYYPSDLRPSIGTKEVDKSSHKIGINPLTQYGTPAGIYCYPVQAYWKNLNSYNIDFAGQNPIVWIFKPRDSDNICRASTYSDEDWEKDKDTLEDLYPKYNVDSILAGMDRRYRYTPFIKLWTITRYIAYKQKGFDPNERLNDKNKLTTSATWSVILSYFYDGMVDDTGSGTIHSNEPTQAVFWTKAQIEVLDKIDRTNGGKIKDYSTKEQWAGGNVSLSKNTKLLSKIYDMLKNEKKLPRHIIQAYKKDTTFKLLFYAYRGKFDKMTKYLSSNDLPEAINRKIFDLYLDKADPSDYKNINLRSLTNLDIQAKYPSGKISGWMSASYFKRATPEEIFNIGDKVKCIDDSGYTNVITMGKEYEVQRVNVFGPGNIFLRILGDKGFTTGFRSTRFEKVESSDAPKYKVGNEFEPSQMKSDYNVKITEVLPNTYSYDIFNTKVENDKQGGNMEHKELEGFLDKDYKLISPSEDKPSQLDTIKDIKNIIPTKSDSYNPKYEVGDNFICNHPYAHWDLKIIKVDELNDSYSYEIISTKSENYGQVIDKGTMSIKELEDYVNKEYTEDVKI